MKQFNLFALLSFACTFLFNVGLASREGYYEIRVAYDPVSSISIDVQRSAEFIGFVRNFNEAVHAIIDASRETYQDVSKMQELIALHDNTNPSDRIVDYHNFPENYHATDIGNTPIFYAYLSEAMVDAVQTLPSIQGFKKAGEMKATQEVTVNPDLLQDLEFVKNREGFFEVLVPLTVSAQDPLYPEFIKGVHDQIYDVMDGLFHTYQSGSRMEKAIREHPYPENPVFGNTPEVYYVDDTTYPGVALFHAYLSLGMVDAVRSLSPVESVYVSLPFEYQNKCAEVELDQFYNVHVQYPYGTIDTTTPEYQAFLDETIEALHTVVEEGRAAYAHPEKLDQIQADFLAQIPYQTEDYGPYGTVYRVYHTSTTIAFKVYLTPALVSQVQAVPNVYQVNAPIVHRPEDDDMGDWEDDVREDVCTLYIPTPAVEPTTPTTTTTPTEEPTTTTTTTPEDDSEPTTTVVAEPHCTAELKGYACCDAAHTKVFYQDEDGDWGFDFEKQAWCGLTPIEAPASPQTSECWSEALGYPCCTRCHTFIYSDKDGDWSFEHNDWCGRLPENCA